MSVVTAFLTDSTLCIGCKACEVACKEWNRIADDGMNWTGFSYDNTVAVGHSTWRHVKFVEFGDAHRGPAAPGGAAERSSATDEATNPPGIFPGRGGNSPDAASWVFSSDVCKHCEVAGCLEACPTGAIVRTEFGGVYVQPDVCNGCAYCVVSCPFGVVQRNPGDGRAFKCTFCYDRQKAGLEPACAAVCPTESIQFGPLDELRARARRRLEELHARGMDDAHIYDPVESSVGGLHAFFIVRGDVRAYNLPPRPEVPTRHLKAGWTASAVAAGMLLAGSLIAFLGARR